MWVTTGVIGLIIIFGLTYWLTGQYLKKEPRAINAPFEKLKDTGGAVVTLGKCNLHFARTKEFLGSGLDWNLYVDGEKMGSLGSGEERDFSIESGRRSICVGRLLLKSKALTRHFLPGETCRAICQSSIWRGIDLHFEDAGGSPLPGDEPSEGFWRGLLSHGLVRMYSLNGVLAILLFLAVALFFFLSVVNYSGSYFEVIVGWLFWGSTIYIACWGLPVGWWWALFAAYLVFLPISLGRVFFFRRERRW
jgi:hypothetical protein